MMHNFKKVFIFLIFTLSVNSTSSESTNLNGINLLRNDSILSSINVIAKGRKKKMIISLLNIFHESN